LLLLLPSTANFLTGPGETDPAADEGRSGDADPSRGRAGPEHEPRPSSGETDTHLPHRGDKVHDPARRRRGPLGVSSCFRRGRAL
jgi:hypothetical protein